MLPAEPPLSLYIHLPWCVKKCPYCDFNSHETGKDGLAEGKYVDALIRDMEYELPRIMDRQITSIFFGGGTPSLFSPSGLERLLNYFRESLNLAVHAEITMEANPGTAEAERFQAYHDIGINRLSIGVQSFDDSKLGILGRIHNGAEALAAIRMAEGAGFDNINIDLMYGLPGQGRKDSREDIRIACNQPVTHISWYQLTIEPNTTFFSKPPQLPDEDEIWEIQISGQELLAAEGFGQYEISAYARQGRQCRHNINYWQFGDYAGLGAGAHTKITDTGANRVLRVARHRIPEGYMLNAGTAKAIVDERVLAEDDIILEFMMNALRLRQGFTADIFQAHTGLSMESVEPLLDTAIARGLLLQQNGSYRPTKSGFTYLNELLAIFMPAQDF